MRNPTPAIVGFNCATDQARVVGGRLVIKEARCASNEETASLLVARWLRLTRRALIALNAPLGWHTGLTKALQHHSAGAALKWRPNQMFRRLMDDEINRRVGQRSLDVGADRIARTACATRNTFTGATASSLRLEVIRPTLGLLVRPVTNYPATLASADFRTRLWWPLDPHSLAARLQISPGIAHLLSRSCASDIRQCVPYTCWASHILACLPRSDASIRLLHVAPASCLRLPYDPSVTPAAIAFRQHFTVPGV